MKMSHRKSAPEVVGGRVRKKNNWELSPNYYDTPQALPVVDRKRPGKGYRHVLRRKDLHDFLGMLPDWLELSRGLNAVVLAPGEWDADGYHVPGVVHVCAWEEGMWKDFLRDTPFFRDPDHEPAAETGRPGRTLCRGLCAGLRGAPLG